MNRVKRWITPSYSKRKNWLPTEEVGKSLEGISRYQNLNQSKTSLRTVLKKLKKDPIFKKYAKDFKLTERVITNAKDEHGIQEVHRMLLDAQVETHHEKIRKLKKELEAARSSKGGIIFGIGANASNKAFRVVRDELQREYGELCKTYKLGNELFTARKSKHQKVIDEHWNKTHVIDEKSMIENMLNVEKCDLMIKIRSQMISEYGAFKQKLSKYGEGSYHQEGKSLDELLNSVFKDDIRVNIGDKMRSFYFKELDIVEKNIKKLRRKKPGYLEEFVERHEQRVKTVAREQRACEQKLANVRDNLVEQGVLEEQLEFIKKQLRDEYDRGKFGYQILLEKTNVKISALNDTIKDSKINKFERMQGIIEKKGWESYQESHMKAIAACDAAKRGHWDDVQARRDESVVHLNEAHFKRECLRKLARPEIKSLMESILKDVDERALASEAISNSLIHIIDCLPPYGTYNKEGGLDHTQFVDGNGDLLARFQNLPTKLKTALRNAIQVEKTASEFRVDTIFINRVLGSDKNKAFGRLVKALHKQDDSITNKVKNFFGNKMSVRNVAKSVKRELTRQKEKTEQKSLMPNKIRERLIRDHKNEIRGIIASEIPEIPKNKREGFVQVLFGKLDQDPRILGKEGEKRPAANAFAQMIFYKNARMGTMPAFKTRADLLAMYNTWRTLGYKDFKNLVFLDQVLSRGRIIRLALKGMGFSDDKKVLTEESKNIINGERMVTDDEIVAFNKPEYIIRHYAGEASPQRLKKERGMLKRQGHSESEVKRLAQGFSAEFIDAIVKSDPQSDFEKSMSLVDKISKMKNSTQLEYNVVMKYNFWIMKTKHNLESPQAIKDYIKSIYSNKSSKDLQLIYDGYFNPKDVPKMILEDALGPEVPAEQEDSSIPPVPPAAPAPVPPAAPAPPVPASVPPAAPNQPAAAAVGVPPVNPIAGSGVNNLIEGDVTFAQERNEIRDKLLESGIAMDKFSQVMQQQGKTYISLYTVDAYPRDGNDLSGTSAQTIYIDNLIANARAAS